MKRGKMVGEKTHKFAALVCYITSNIPDIYTTQLCKAIYLLELEYYVKFGEKLTEIPLVRIPMGPVPQDYSDQFEKLKNQKILSIRKYQQFKKHYHCRKNIYANFFSSVELEILSPILKQIQIIINTRPDKATNILKKMSYDTFPMQRIQQIENRKKPFNTSLVGTEILTNQFIHKNDIDPLAEYRRCYNHRSKIVPAYSEQDMLNDENTLNEFRDLMVTE